MQIAIVPRHVVPKKTKRGLGAKTMALLSTIDRIASEDQAAFVSGERPPNHYRTLAKKYRNLTLSVVKGELDDEQGYFLYLK